jgi:outer membrane protein TolC
MPSDLLERRPDILSAESTLLSRNAEIGVAITGYFPVVRLTASGGVHERRRQVTSSILIAACGQLDPA